MFDRRNFLHAALAGTAVLPATSLAAYQTADDRAYGTPAGTRPFGPEVYRERRQRLMAQMKGGIAVVFGAASLDTSNPVAGMGRQLSDFAYLTGIVDEPGAALLLAPVERRFKEMLFLANRNPEQERWEGERLGLGQSLRDRTGFEKIFRSGSLGASATTMASHSKTLNYLGPLVGADNPLPRELELYGRIAARVPGAAIKDQSGLIAAMRLAKEPREIALIRKSIAATERGLRAGMAAARPGMSERQLANIIEAEFRAAGAQGLAFPSIVGTGRSSAVLHYTGRDGIIRAGDIILCDVGAEVDFYAADITRTFPVDGRFAPEQRTIYQTVLAAQDAAAAQLRPGALYEDLNETARDVVRRAGHLDDFVHGLGHFVGLNVHDAGDYAQPLPVGTVITLEPGIYLPQRGFGVRIEDDYLVTADGNEHLSRSIPRSIDEVEAAAHAGR
ncbi:MAG: Xaa-Pro peptidase family protein [Pseudomonadota bacterium]|nr:Xaa-Pro peptidase family protein [Pseudomonadota bacterium]